MPVRLPVALLVVALGLTLGLVGLAVLSEEPAGAGRAPRPTAASAPAETSAPKRALAVLHDWDLRRAAAWAASDEAALARLYTARSSAGRSDVALLRRYRERGVTVPDVRMQVLRAAVLVDRPGRVVLRVTERLVTRAARVGTRPVPLPRDAAESHVIDLRKVRGTWRVAAVTDR